MFMKSRPILNLSNPCQFEVWTTLLIMADYKQPKKMERAKVWTDEVEEAYRFQLAGYRDENEYLSVNKGQPVNRWTHNNYVKRLQRRDGYYYYFNKQRECPDKDLYKVKLYLY